MNDKTATIDALKQRVNRFVKERDWEGYHSPKNLSMSIAVEAAELMECFQWLTPEESRTVLKNRKVREEIEDEIADIATYILDFCLLFDIDLSGAVARKIVKNEKKYPAELVKGKHHKYTHYQKRRRTV